MKSSRLAIFLSALACIVVGVLLTVMRVEKKNKARVSSSTPPSISAQGLSNTASPTPLNGSPAAIRPNPSPKSKEQAPQASVAVVQSIFNAPISFYGRVIDQFGTPVSEARINYGAVDKFWENGSDYHGTSDENGYFSITEIKGAGLTVGVSKEGYDGIKGKSYQAFGYGMGVDEYRQKPPTQDSPAIFVLRKRAKAEPLIAISTNFRVPKNGSPIEISLRTGGQVSGQGDLKIECWTADQNKDAHRHYEWHCRFSVPGGGLLERGDQLDQQAPADGYKPFAEFEMAQNAQPWRPSAGGEYFLRLGNGSYARARLQMIAGGDHFATIESYLNPKSGSRNLEYDPHAQ